MGIKKVQDWASRKSIFVGAEDGTFVSIRGSFLVENELSCLDVGTYAIARHELSFQQRETQRVEQAALNHPLKRSRTVYWIVSFFGQQSFGTFAQSQLEMLLFQPPQHARQLNFNNLGQLFIRESIEDDYLVYPVQEFRPEMVAERFHDSTISFRALASINNELATDITGHDDDRVFEVDSSSLPIRNPSIV